MLKRAVFEADVPYLAAPSVISKVGIKSGAGGTSSSRRKLKSESARFATLDSPRC